MRKRRNKGCEENEENEENDVGVVLILYLRSLKLHPKKKVFQFNFKSHESVKFSTFFSERQSLRVILCSCLFMSSGSKDPFVHSGPARRLSIPQAHV